jgi:uncharacterized protein YjeT (DUF2065 family)
VTDLLTALALVLVIEGLCYALVPDAIRRVMGQLLQQPAGNLRLIGVATMAVGVVGIWLIRG